MDTKVFVRDMRRCAVGKCTPKCLWYRQSDGFFCMEKMVLDAATKIEDMDRTIKRKCALKKEEG